LYGRETLFIVKAAFETRTVCNLENLEKREQMVSVRRKQAWSNCRLFRRAEIIFDDPIQPPVHRGKIAPEPASFSAEVIEVSGRWATEGLLGLC